jgi:APA family basic amino acid/polyamine antiporter
MMYLTCSVAALKLCWNGTLGTAGRQLSAFLLVAMLATLYATWTLFGAGMEPLLWSVGLYAVGLPVYWVMKRQAA